MSFIDDAPGLEAGLDDILNLLGIAKNQSLQDEITRLYHEADALAVFSVKSIVALYWWASHIASATATALTYSQQMLAENTTTNATQLQAWRTFLNIKHPRSLKTVYIHTTRDIQVTKRIIQQLNNAELAKLAKEVAALETWKNKYVNPNLRNLILFLKAWEAIYKPAVSRWVRWFGEPRLFAQWAAGPLIAYLPTYLSTSNAQPPATRIEAALVNTWQRDPGVIWSAVQTWLVTEQS